MITGIVRSTGLGNDMASVNDTNSLSTVALSSRHRARIASM
jgi:hypothetical protein